MNTKSILYIIAIWAAYSVSVDLMIAHKVDSIKQEITELRKDFSYDPKDAK